MEATAECKTLALAIAVQEIAMRKDIARAPVWAATFENSRFFAQIRTLAASADSGGASLYLCMQEADGCGEAYSFGRAGDRTAPVVPSDDDFPLRGAPPAGDVVMILVEGVGSAAKTTVKSWRDGLPHGARPGSPAEVEATADGVRAAYFVSGVPVTDLVLAPAATAAVALAALGSTDLERHPMVAAAVLAAEADNEAVTLRLGGRSGLCLAKPPGPGTYAPVTRDEADCSARDWGETSSVLTVVFGLDGRRCASVRRVRGVVDGATADRPATCSSATTDGGVATARAVLFDRGTRIGPAPSDKALQTPEAQRP